MEDERQSGREHNIFGGGIIFNRIFFFATKKKERIIPMKITT